MFSPEDYAFDLPPEQIAQAPATARSGSRMLVLPAGEGDREGGREGVQEGDREGGHEGGQGRAAPRHALVADLARELSALPQTPLIVVNDSRVVPARVYAERVGGRRFELLVVDPGPRGPGESLRAWVRGAKKLRVDDRLVLGDGLLNLRYLGREGELPGASVGESSARACVFEILEGELLAALEAVGELPLPPYVTRLEGPSAADAERYQTLYARDRGSVAAPTAGLHFDAALLAELDIASLTLHVGPGTFLPMDVEDVRGHKVGAERYSIAEHTASRIAAARAEGRPILAVGTTVTRALESVAAGNGGAIVPGSGQTELVITPGHRFAAVDMLMTNFHLPSSSLLMLVCCFAGRQRTLSAYALAVAEGYRFYSYGDCMLIQSRAPA